MRLGRFVRARLHRQLFVWLGVTILVTGAVTLGVVNLLRSDSDSFQHELHRVERFVGGRFARVWDEPAERRELGQAFAEAFHLDLRLTDGAGKTLEAFGASCPRGQFTVEVERAGAELGRVEVCTRSHHPHASSFLIAVGAACLTLWVASGALAHRLLRPLSDLIRVTREIGSGNLASRVRLGRHHGGELGVLSEAVNDMARRIERQLGDQRELLAAVSHEIRSPLARLGVLTELLRSSGANAEALGRVEREIREIDELVGKLLASSRLDFEALNKQALDAKALVAHALERAGLDAVLLEAPDPAPRIRADATLLDRALANLLENAHKHGRGVEAVRIEVGPRSLQIRVQDRGPGFAEGTLSRAFEAFYRGDGSSSLGLGLSLVQRIARAHGGRAWAENRAGGGAIVSLELPLES